MFTVNRAALIENLIRLRRKICVYHSPQNRRCDCKYGAVDDVCGSGGESHGCPELRLCILILEVMPDWLYRFLVKRGGGVIL